MATSAISSGHFGVFRATAGRSSWPRVRDHISQVRTNLSSESEAEVKTMLERIGDPAHIAAEARDRFDAPTARPGALEFGALLLAIGGLVLLTTASLFAAIHRLHR